MADSKRPRRPVAGSRNTARSPKRLAGQPARPEPGTFPEPDDKPDDEPDDAAAAAATEPDAGAEPDAQDDSTAGQEARSGVLHRRRTTVILAALTGVVAVLLALLVVLQVREPDTTVDDAQIWSPVARAGEFELPAEGELPVTVDTLDWRESVDEIAHAVTKVLSFDWKTVDKHEELAADLVTEEFLANDLRETIAETGPKLKKAKAEYVVTVAGQSVVSATPDRVRALLFVNQLVTKGSGKGAESDNYPLRLDVVGERVDGEWRIAELDAG